MADQQVTATIGGQTFTFPNQQAADSARREFENSVLERYPPNVRNLAKQLVGYNIPLPQGFALARPNSPWNLAAQAASELDPTWNAMEYQTRLQALRNFRSGNDAEAIRSFNTVLGHLSSMKKSGEALNNTPITGLNKVINYIEQHSMDDPRVNRFLTDAAAVASELTRAFRLTGGAEADVQRWYQGLNPNLGPNNIRSGIDEAIRLLATRIAASREKYKSAMGPAADNFPIQFLYPDSMKALSELGVKPEFLLGIANQSANSQASAGGGPSKPPLSAFERK